MKFRYLILLALLVVFPRPSFAQMADKKTLTLQEAQKIAAVTEAAAVKTISGNPLQLSMTVATCLCSIAWIMPSLPA